MARSAEVVPGNHSLGREVARKVAGLHSFELHEVLIGNTAPELLLARDLLRDQDVPCPGPQGVDELLVELLDLLELLDRHVGHLVHPGEPLLHEDGGDLLVDFKGVLEPLDEPLGGGLVLLLPPPPRS